MFRELRPSEIEVRIGRKTETGVFLLLYKDARCDMNILDETIGNLYWKRSHHRIVDRLYCTVSIYNKEIGEWVDKSDCGVASDFEKEKGECSDSFKRACFNWGIGRELYTAPTIFIPNCKLKFTDKGNILGNLYVDKILYKDHKILGISIINDKKENVFKWRKIHP